MMTTAAPSMGKGYSQSRHSIVLDGSYSPWTRPMMMNWHMPISIQWPRIEKTMKYMMRLRTKGQPRLSMTNVSLS